MIILGIALVLIIPLLITYLSYSQNAEEQIIGNQIYKIGNEIISKSEEIYYYGEPSKTTLRVIFPKNIKEINFQSNEIIFKIKTTSGISEEVFFSKVPITGLISNHEGIHNIIIESKGDSVWLSE